MIDHMLEKMQELTSDVNREKCQLFLHVSVVDLKH
jgi:hypothetical protein